MYVGCETRFNICELLDGARDVMEGFNPVVIVWSTIDTGFVKRSRAMGVGRDGR